MTEERIGDLKCLDGSSQQQFTVECNLCKRLFRSRTGLGNHQRVCGKDTHSALLGKSVENVDLNKLNTHKASDLSKPESRNDSTTGRDRTQRSIKTSALDKLVFSGVPEVQLLQDMSASAPLCNQAISLMSHVFPSSLRGIYTDAILGRGSYCQNRCIVLAYPVEVSCAASIQWIQQHRIMELLLFATAPALRRMSCGSTLQAYICLVAKRCGCEAVVLHADPKAQDFWWKCKFVPFASAPPQLRNTCIRVISDGMKDTIPYLRELSNTTEASLQRETLMARHKMYQKTESWEHAHCKLQMEVNCDVEVKHVVSSGPSSRNLSDLPDGILSKDVTEAANTVHNAIDGVVLTDIPGISGEADENRANKRWLMARKHRKHPATAGQQNRECQKRQKLLSAEQGGAPVDQLFRELVPQNCVSNTSPSNSSSTILGTSSSLSALVDPPRHCDHDSGRTTTHRKDVLTTNAELECWEGDDLDGTDTELEWQVEAGCNRQRSISPPRSHTASDGEDGNMHVLQRRMLPFSAYWRDVPKSVASSAPGEITAQMLFAAIDEEGQHSSEEKMLALLHLARAQRDAQQHGMRCND